MTATPSWRWCPRTAAHTLIARRDGEVDGVPRYVFDVHLQGDDETVFFEA